MKTSTPSPKKSILKRSPSYMGEGSPHRHEKSYDEEWVHKPLTRVNTLSQDSFVFALSLRPDESTPNHVALSKNATQAQNPSSRQTNGACANAECKQALGDAERLKRKNAYLKKMIKQCEREFAVAENENSVIEEHLTRVQNDKNECNNDLYQMKIFERKKNYPVQIEANRKKVLDLQLQIDKLQKILLTLRREHLKRELPHSSLFPEEQLAMIDIDDTIIIINEKVKDDDKSKSKGKEDNNTHESISTKPKLHSHHYFHSGTFIRSACTRWELSWTCCQSTDATARGCQSNPKTESKKYTTFVKSKSERYIKTVDQWSKSRHDERPGVKEFRQWSSSSLRPSSTLKSFPLNRLYKTNHKSNSYAKLVVPQPLF